MKVTVSVRGRFHGLDLARELHRLGALGALLTSSPRQVCDRMGLRDAKVHSLPAYELAARAARRAPRAIDRALEAPIAAAYARAAAARLPLDGEVFVGWSGSSLEALARAKALGQLTVLERGSAHIEAQGAILAELARTTGLPVRQPPPEVIRRELAEYNLADRIAVPSPFVARTFLERGIDASRLLLNPYGVDLGAFRPAELPAPSPRILCVGRVGARKGSHLLAQAFLESDALGELHFVGPIEREFAPLLRQLQGPRVRFLGPVRQADLPELYRSASAFALASFEEGLAMVVLQAMASGLPVVVSTHTGVEGLFDERDGALLFPAGDGAALAKHLEAVTRDAARARELGRRAALRVQSGFAWEDYGKRALAHYAALLGQAAPLPIRGFENPTQHRWVSPHRRRRAA